MAIQNQSVSSVEHDFYQTRSGLTGNPPLSDCKSKYFSDQGYGGVNKPISQMEFEWLSAQTGVTSNRIPDMWREAVAGLSLTPENSTDQNKRIFFENLP